MRDYLQRRWFLIALVGTIAAGHGAGSRGPAELVAGVDAALHDVVKACINAAVLFCMSVTLDGRRFRQALLSPAPVLWAVTVNAALMPLAAPWLMGLQLSPDFAAGVLIAASVPSTMAAASVWTRRAGGNDAISLLVTLITNGACVLYTPFWLTQFGASSVELDTASMMHKLLLTALVPTVAGQLVRLLPAAAAAVDRRKTALGVAAQLGILLIVFSAACDGGARLRDGGPHTVAAPTFLSLAVATVSCVGLHLAALGVATAGSRLLRLSRADAIAVAFAASQKTLPIGVLIATDPGMFGAAYPWAVFPMLIYHASQLFIDASIAEALLARTPPAAAGSESAAAR